MFETSSAGCHPYVSYHCSLETRGRESQRDRMLCPPGTFVPTQTIYLASLTKSTQKKPAEVVGSLAVPSFLVKKKTPPPCWDDFEGNTERRTKPKMIRMT